MYTFYLLETMHVCMYCMYVLYVPFLNFVTPHRGPASGGTDTVWQRNERRKSITVGIVHIYTHSRRSVCMYVCMALTPDTEVSSTANVFSAFCMRS